MTNQIRVVQEHDRVPLRGGLLIVLIAVLVSAGAVGVSALLAGARARAARVVLPRAAATSMPEQSLVERTERGVALRDAQRAELDKYEWLDRDAGIVRIPVERAIDLVAERAR
jgi:hypothetical protein